MTNLSRLSSGDFDALANEVWQGLLVLIPEEFKQHFDKIQILIEDRPSRDLLSTLEDTELAEEPDLICGLHIGVPLPQESVTFPSLFPARVYLFRNAILELAEFDGTTAGFRRLREEIAITLLHEIGHYFGLGEDDLDRLGFA